MGKSIQAFLAFNRGIISRLGLSRIDVEKVPLCAEEQENWFPRLLGSMMLRPGLQFLFPTKDNNKAIYLDFIFSATQTALIEFTNQAVRFVNNDDELITRPSVTATITNGSFNGNLDGWMDNDEAGTTSQWVSGNFMQLVGNGVNAARRTQEVIVSDIGVQHAVRIIIERGPVLFRIGSTLGDDDYVNQITLGTGTHSLAFIPQGNFYVNFYSILQREVLVKSIEIESAGILTLPSPYTEELLPLIRESQSLDVVYLACRGLQQRKLQRSGSGDSWSIVLYQPEDGPVRIENTTQITLRAGALFGNTTLVANQKIFRPTHIGAIYKLISIGQNVAQSINADDVFTDYIKVEGIGNTRAFTVNILGTWVATITLEQSFDNALSWQDATTYTSNTTTTFNDGLDNQIVLYRIGIKTGDYTSGDANVSLSYSLGSITGYVRVTAVNSETNVNIEILRSLGSTDPTPNWSEGEWSDYRGWPSAVALAEARLGFGGIGKFIASIVDAYESFDDDVEGDAGLISRDLGSGAISDVNWLISLYRLFAGCDTSVKSIRTSSFEEPLTPTNYRVVDTSTQSTSNISPAKMDKTGIFVQGAGTRVFQITDSQNGLDYTADELTKVCPEIGTPSILRIGIQRQPETMIHCVREDGKVAILIFDPLENLKGWFLASTNGFVEDVVIKSGFNTIEDHVYYSIKREVDGNTVRYLEKYAYQYECQGDVLNKQADSFITYSGAPTNTIGGLEHLEGEQVVVWADGKDLSPSSGLPDARIQKTYTVTSGNIILDSGVLVSNAIVGLGYSSFYKSSKLSYAAPMPLGQIKKVNNLAMVIYNTHYQGIRYGRDINSLDNMPLVNPNTGRKVGTNKVYETLDSKMFAFGGSWDTDSRICLSAQAPRPATIDSCEFSITTNETQ